MTGRRQLPNRRLKISYAVDHGALRWRVDFGWDHGGKIREVFVAPAGGVRNTIRPDSERMRELEDTMILASFCLQTGDDVASLARRFVRAADAAPLTLFERVLRLAVEIEPRDAEAARLAYACAQPQRQEARSPATGSEGEDRDGEPDTPTPAPPGA